MESFFTDLLSIKFSSSIQALVYCQTLAGSFGLTIQQEQSTSQIIYITCFTSQGQSWHLDLKKDKNGWIFRWHKLPQYHVSEEHQKRLEVGARVNRLQKVGSKLFAAAAGSQVLTDLALVELQRLLATVCQKPIETGSTTAITIPPHLFYVKQHNHHVLQDLDHFHRRQNQSLETVCNPPPMIYDPSSCTTLTFIDQAPLPVPPQDPWFLN